MLLQFQPMPLLKPFSDLADPIAVSLPHVEDADGFHALARIKPGRCQLISRNGNSLASFSMAKSCASASKAG